MHKRNGSIFSGICLRTIASDRCYKSDTTQAANPTAAVGNTNISKRCDTAFRCMLSCLLLWVQGEAHLLLEAYKAAETAFLAGLGIDPTDQALTDGLKLTHKAISEADKAEANPHKRSAGHTMTCPLVPTTQD